jgi:nucleoside-diphosphate-sugar epimerase
MIFDKEKNIKRLLITGANGFLGKNLIAKIKADYQEIEIFAVVRSVSNSSFLLSQNVKVVSYDGSFASLNDFFSAHQVDAIVHLATHYIFDHEPSDIEKLLDSNIKFGLHLLEAATKNGCFRFINASSYVQNFFSDDFYPSCLYAVTKQAMENAISFYAKNRDLASITLKLFDTYGANDPRKKILTLFKEAQKNNLTLKMSPGDQELRLSYIDDVVEAFIVAIKMIENDKVIDHKIYYVADKPYTLREVAKIFEKSSEKKLSISWGALPYRKSQPMKSYIGKILPNWRPQTNLCEGIKKILNQ